MNYPSVNLGCILASFQGALVEKRCLKQSTVTIFSLFSLAIINNGSKRICKKKSPKDFNFSFSNNCTIRTNFYRVESFLLKRATNIVAFC